jgi:hypothetical protein
MLDFSGDTKIHFGLTQKNLCGKRALRGDLRTVSTTFSKHENKPPEEDDDL